MQDRSLAKPDRVCKNPGGKAAEPGKVRGLGETAVWRIYSIIKYTHIYYTLHTWRNRETFLDARTLQQT